MLADTLGSVGVIVSSLLIQYKVRMRECGVPQRYCDMHVFDVRRDGTGRMRVLRCSFPRSYC